MFWNSDCFNIFDFLEMDFDGLVVFGGWGGNSLVLRFVILIFSKNYFL